MRLAPATLENAFVRLEPLKERHREPLRAAGADPTIWTFVLTTAARDRFDGYFDAQVAALRAGSRIPYAVLSKVAGSIVGATAHFMIDAHHCTVEIGGTWYVRDAWGGTVNPASKLLLLDRAFATGANRVEFKTDARNARSRAALEKLGAKLDGVMRRRHVMTDGYIRDTAYYSILAEEWPELRVHVEMRLASA